VFTSALVAAVFTSALVAAVFTSALVAAVFTSTEHSALCRWLFSTVSHGMAPAKAPVLPALRCTLQLQVQLLHRKTMMTLSAIGCTG
jgi:multidrug efflux pump subunit AcrB